MQQQNTTVFDPIRFCVFTTIALIAWVVGPPLAVLLMSGLGLWAYSNAWRQGLRQSKCFLRDPRLVMLYLGGAFVLALAFTVRDLGMLLGIL
jgi:hypothetical protein